MTILQEIIQKYGGTRTAKMLGVTQSAIVKRNREGGVKWLKETTQKKLEAFLESEAKTTQRRLDEIRHRKNIF